MSEYDDFIKEVTDLENILKCPKCGFDGILHASYINYIFLCSNCGNEYYYNKQKKLLTNINKV